MVTRIINQEDQDQEPVGRAPRSLNGNAVETPVFESDQTRAYDEAMREHLKKFGGKSSAELTAGSTTESYNDAIKQGGIMGFLGAVMANLADLLAKNKRGAQAGEGLRSADIGETTATGILLYEQNEDLRGKNEGGVRKDGLIVKRISLAEMSHLSDTGVSGDQWNAADKARNTEARQRLKTALDGNGDDTVQESEIKDAVKALRLQGIVMEVDAEALAHTLNTGKLPQKQREK